MNNRCTVHIDTELTATEYWESVYLYGVPLCDECLEIL